MHMHKLTQYVVTTFSVGTPWEEDTFLPGETSWVHINSILCAPRLVWHRYPCTWSPLAWQLTQLPSEWLGLPDSCRGPAVYAVHQSPQTFYWLGRVKSKIRSGGGRKGSFCPINKPCVPNFTLILSLRQLCPSANTGCGRSRRKVLQYKVDMVRSIFERLYLTGQNKTTKKTKNSVFSWPALLSYLDHGLGKDTGIWVFTGPDEEIGDGNHYAECTKRLALAISNLSVGWALPVI